MKKINILCIIPIIILVLASCSGDNGSGHIQYVGMLLDGTIDQNGWNEKGYQGLLKVDKEFDTHIYFQENTTTDSEVREAVKAFVEDGVNLIFGNSNIYGNYFLELSRSYPDVHFVYFNGGAFSEKVTSLNFHTHAMGYFSGMVAGKMTKTNHVSIIAAFPWQPEIEGFYEGVKYQNPAATVDIDIVDDWQDTEAATRIYERMRDNGSDIFYPTGVAFSDTIISIVEADGLYAIGFVTDQLEAFPDTILTSTVQNVDKLFQYATEEFNQGRLEGNILSFDFQDEYITLGNYHESVPKGFQNYLDKAIHRYMNKGLLPNEH